METARSLLGADYGMKKEHILSEIKRTAADNGGVPLGMDRFREATGIRKEDWFGIHWAKWTDAQVEAGFERNRFGTSVYLEEQMLAKLADYIRELGKYPSRGELKLRKQSDPEFPSLTTFDNHFGGKKEILNRILEHCCSGRDWQDVIDICLKVQAAVTGKAPLEDNSGDAEPEIGHVYLLKHDKAYKIGRSRDATRRYKEIRTQMPHKTEELHVSETDDPVGIEIYWHNRFNDKRLEGEWFSLSAAGVKAFKKRRFM